MRLIGIALAIYSLFFVAAVVVRFITRWHPLLVAFAVGVLGFAALLIWDHELIGSEYGDVFATLHATIAAVGILPALAGAALANRLQNRNATKSRASSSADREE